MGAIRSGRSRPRGEREEMTAAHPNKETIMETPTHADTMNDLDHRFTYHAPKPGQLEKYVAIRDKAKDLAVLITDSSVASRERSLALTEDRGSGVLGERGYRLQRVTE